MSDLTAEERKALDSGEWLDGLTHSHDVHLAFYPGFEKDGFKKATITHAHGERPEEPHFHRVHVGITTSKAATKG